MDAEDVARNVLVGEDYSHRKPMLRREAEAGKLFLAKVFDELGGVEGFGE
jgi:hypothetical protein